MWSSSEITRLEFPSLDTSGTNNTAVETSDAESHVQALVSQILICDFSAKEIWFCIEFGREPPMKMPIYKWYKMFNEVHCICKEKNPSKWPVTEARMNEVWIASRTM